LNVNSKYLKTLAVPLVGHGWYPRALRGGRRTDHESHGSDRSVLKVSHPLAADPRREAVRRRPSHWSAMGGTRELCEVVAARTKRLILHLDLSSRCPIPSLWTLAERPSDVHRPTGRPTGRPWVVPESSARWSPHGPRVARERSQRSQGVPSSRRGPSQRGRPTSAVPLVGHGWYLRALRGGHRVDQET
jgi:hypothetical protein